MKESVKSFSIHTTKRLEIMDVTDSVQERVSKSAKAVLVFCPHTTCAVIINEFEDRLARDFLSVARPWYAERWEHDASDGNAAAHLLSSQLGAGVTVPVQEGKLALGAWQKILFMELDGPRRRTIQVQNR